MCKGDKKAEEKVDERLLIPFRHCLRWNIDEQSTLSEKHHQHQYQVSTYVSQVVDYQLTKQFHVSITLS